MIATPSCLAIVGLLIATFTPSIRISDPSSGACARERIFIKVDFPAPFSPISAWTSPSLISRDTSFRARTRPKVFETRCISRNGGEVEAHGLGPLHQELRQRRSGSLRRQLTGNVLIRLAERRALAKPKPLKRPDIEHS